MYFLAVASTRCDMQEPLEKLSGEPLSIDQLIEYLPALDVSDVPALLGTVRARGLSVANRHVSDLTKATSRVTVHTLKGTSFKAELEKTYREASGSPSVFRRRNSLTLDGAQLEQSNSPQPLHAELGSSMDHRFGTTPEITISRYANF
jgi:hypothetical protein